MQSITYSRARSMIQTLHDTRLLTHESHLGDTYGMGETRKVQVTLDAEQYERLCDIAEREGKSLAGVVRESIVRYSLEPAARRHRQRALETLTGIEEPVPDDYASWERDYSRAKAGAPATDREG